MSTRIAGRFVIFTIIHTFLGGEFCNHHFLSSGHPSAAVQEASKLLVDALKKEHAAASAGPSRCALAGCTGVSDGCVRPPHSSGAMNLLAQAVIRSEVHAR